MLRVICHGKLRSAIFPEAILTSAGSQSPSSKLSKSRKLAKRLYELSEEMVRE